MAPHDDFLADSLAPMTPQMQAECCVAQDFGSHAGRAPGHGRKRSGVRPSACSRRRRAMVALIQFLLILAMTLGAMRVLARGVARPVRVSRRP